MLPALRFRLICMPSLCTEARFVLSALLLSRRMSPRYNVRRLASLLCSGISSACRFRSRRSSSPVQDSLGVSITEQSSHARVNLAQARASAGRTYGRSVGRTYHSKKLVYYTLGGARSGSPQLCIVHAGYFNFSLWESRILCVQ